MAASEDLLQQYFDGELTGEAAEAVRSLLARELTADSAVQVALLNNRDLQATYEDLSVAQSDLVAAGLLRNPVFDAEVRFGEAGGGTGVALGVAQDFLDVLFIPLCTRCVAGLCAAASKGHAERTDRNDDDTTQEVHVRYSNDATGTAGASPRMRRTSLMVTGSPELPQLLRT